MRTFQKLLFASLLLGGTAIAGPEQLPVGARCRMEFAQADDAADKDMREVNRLIALLENEIADPGVVLNKDSLREKLVAAKLRRTQVLAKQHDDFNAIRDRCNKLRQEERNTVAPPDRRSPAP